MAAEGSVEEVVVVIVGRVGVTHPTPGTEVVDASVGPHKTGNDVEDDVVVVAPWTAEANNAKGDANTAARQSPGKSVRRISDTLVSTGASQMSPLTRY